MVDYKITDRPIIGDVSQNSRSTVEQITPAEFLARLDAVFAFPEVEALKWVQYTPYFNDGDECVFSVQYIYVRITGVAEDAGDYEDGFIDSWSLNPKYRRDDLPKGPDYNGIHEALGKFDDSEYWEDIARENFGDHAEVTATREGFSVDYYEHD